MGHDDIARMLSPKKLVNVVDEPRIGDFECLIDHEVVGPTLERNDPGPPKDCAGGETSHYERIAEYLNCTVRRCETVYGLLQGGPNSLNLLPFDRVPMDPLHFIKGDMYTKDGVQNAARLKPDIYGFRSKTAPAKGEIFDLFWNLRTTGKHPASKDREAAFVCEVKDNWTTLQHQAATYARAQMDAVPLRHFVVVIGVNHKCLPKKSKSKSKSVPDESMSIPDESKSIPDEMSIPDESMSIPDESMSIPDESMSISDESKSAPGKSNSIPKKSEPSLALKFFIFHRGGVTTHNPLFLNDDKDRKQVTKMMLAITLWQSQEDAGLPPFTDPQGHMLPYPSMQVREAIACRLCVRGRATCVLHVEPMTPLDASRDIYEALPVNQQHQNRLPESRKRSAPGDGTLTIEHSYTRAY